VIYARNVARWHVKGHLKTPGYCRKTQPNWLGRVLGVVLRLQKILFGIERRQPAGLMAG